MDLRTRTALFLSICVAACSNNGTSGTATSASAPASVAAPACPSGARPDASGHCVTDAPPVVSPAGSLPSASASADVPLGKCPDLANTEKVAAFDWGSAFDGVDAPLGSKLKGVSGTASETKALASDLEVELRAACAGLATQLGAKGPLGSADVACQAAVDSLRTTRTKLGPGAKITLNTHAPVCPTAEDVMNECADRCAGGSKHTSACEGGAPPVGKCAESCDGVCELRTAATCDGTCEGKCASGFAGTCGGICKGKCGGKELKEGFCGAKCEGTCEGVSKGACKGPCDGACAGKVSACAGLCEGKCSGTMQDPKCVALPKVDGLSNDCNAYCATRVIRKSACTEAVVSVTIKDAKDPAAKLAYEQSVERSLPLVLKVQRQLTGRINTISKNQDAVAEGLKTITANGSKALPQLNPCLFGVQKTVTEGISTLTADAKAADLVVVTAEAK